jgi:outer membrane protein OmpA-like peptidoglycan-associated protein
MRYLFLAAALLAMAGCASSPPRNDRLESARAEVQSLAQDPLTAQAASQDLDAARDRLQQADTALANKRPAEEIDHLAYLAQRHAEAGAARVEAAHSKEQLARATDERNRVLLEARAREAAAAKEKLAATQAQLAELQAKQTNRGMVVTLSGVLFDTGRATLKPGAELTLDRLSTMLKQNANARVMIDGFTDNTGSPETNQTLSQQRADAVAAALIARGVSADRVRAVGRGEEYPVATNSTAAGRQQNRRVEIVLSDASGRFAQSEEPAQR